MSDFDDRMNALMGRFAAWKSKGDALPVPVASASGSDAGGQSDDQSLRSTAAEMPLRPVIVDTVTLPPLPGKTSDSKEASAPVVSASDQSAFNSHMTALEERMLAWKLRAEDIPPPLLVPVATGPAPCEAGASADKRYMSSRIPSEQVSPMTNLVPNSVWASKCPAQHTSYAFLSGMSSTSTRSGCSYAETLPASTGLQEEVVQFPVERPGTNLGMGTGDASPSSTTLCTASQPVQEAGSNQLSQRVSSLEESMHNIEWLLQCLVKDKTEVRNAVRPGCRGKAKFLEGPVGSESLEALTSTLGAEPEHEPSRLNEESQRTRLPASSIRSSDVGRARATGGAPIGSHHDATTADEASEVRVVVPKSNPGEKAADDECAARRGRFRWPLDIVRAREELRDEVRKELHARR